MDATVYVIAAVLSVALFGMLNYSYLCRRVVLPLIAARRGWTCDSSPCWFVKGQTRTMITIRGEHRGYRFEAVQRSTTCSLDDRHISEATLFTTLRMPYVAIRFPGMGRKPTLHGDLATLAALRATDDAEWLPHWRLSGSLVSMHENMIDADWQGHLRPPGLLRRLDLLADTVEGYQSIPKAARAPVG